MDTYYFVRILVIIFQIFNVIAILQEDLRKNSYQETLTVIQEKGGRVDWRRSGLVEVVEAHRYQELWTVTNYVVCETVKE